MERENGIEVRGRVWVWSQDWFQLQLHTARVGSMKDSCRRLASRRRTARVAVLIEVPSP